MAKNTLHEGLTRKAPASVDKSMTPKGGSVNSEATRSGVAPNLIPKGGRTA